MRYFWLIALLSLSACDSSEHSNEPALPGDLAGTWTLQSSAYQLYLTSSVAQSVPDEARPGVGSVDLSGAVTARLVYAQLADYDGGRPRQVFLSSYDPFTASSPRDGYKLTLYSYENSDYYGYLDVLSATGNGAHYEGPFTSTPFTIQGSQISVAPLSFSGSGQTVSAAGVLTLATTTLAPGVRTLILDVPSHPASASYIFLEGGTYRSTFITNVSTSTSEGSWHTEADALILQARSGAQPDTLRYEIGPGPTLHLKQSTSASCRRDARCLANGASEFGLAPNSLTGYEASVTSAYTRTD